VERIRVFAADGSATDVSPDAIEADTMSDPPRVAVAPAPHPGRPRSGIAVDLRAGFGSTAEDVPATLRLAIKIIVARWFENRGDVAGDQTLPPEAQGLIAPFQRMRV
jgi:uncharacterized phiE125 gp8 family phage protein